MAGLFRNRIVARVMMIPSRVIAIGNLYAAHDRELLARRSAARRWRRANRRPKVLP